MTDNLSYGVKTAIGLFGCGVLLLFQKERIYMSVIRVHKTANFTVMSNHHFKEKKMSLKAKGMLSLMLSLPEDWDYTVAGLVTLSSDGKDGVNTALKELESFGYLTRTRMTNSKGQFAGMEYNIYEHPQEKPIAEKPTQDKPIQEKPMQEKPMQLNTYHIKDLFDKLFIELNTNDPELIAAYRDYIILREEMNAPLNEMSLTKLIARAKRLSNNNVRIEKLLLETAVINNWKNVYPPRESDFENASDEIKNDLSSFFGLE
jgi:hypothetical protein